MNIPGFTAHDSLYASTWCYAKRVNSGWSAAHVVVLARKGGCRLGCYLACAGGFLGCGAGCLAGLLTAPEMAAQGAISAFARCLGPPAEAARRSALTSAHQPGGSRDGADLAFQVCAARGDPWLRVLELLLASLS